MDVEIRRYKNKDDAEDGIEWMAQKGWEVKGFSVKENTVASCSYHVLFTRG